MRKLVCVGVALALSAPAVAQDFAMPGTSIMDHSSMQFSRMQNHIGNLSVRSVARQGAAGSSRIGMSSVSGASGLSFVPGATAATSNFSAPYTPTTAIRRKAEADMIARLQGNNPEAAQALQRETQRHNFSQVASGLLGGVGLRSDDVVDILTGYTVLGYLIANNDLGNPDPGDVRALRGQIAAKVANYPQLTSPANRAALGEEMKLLIATLHAGWKSAQREGNVAQYAQGVNRLFAQQNGTDLRQVRLTSAGFERR